MELDDVLKTVREKCLPQIDRIIHAYDPDADAIDEADYHLTKHLTEAAGEPFPWSLKEWYEGHVAWWDVWAPDGDNMDLTRCRSRRKPYAET